MSSSSFLLPSFRSLLSPFQRRDLTAVLSWFKILVLTLALGLGMTGRADAVSTKIEVGATLGPGNFTWNRMTVINEPSGQMQPFRAYKISLPQSSSATGNYTFTLSTTGFAGSLNLYQSSFDAKQNGVNFWSNGALASNPGIFTYTSNLPAYNTSVSTFYVVVSAKDAGASGSFELSVSGPAAVTVDAQIAPADFNFVDNLVDKTIVYGSSTQLYVYLNGPIPQTFQWYEGATGDQTQPIIGATANYLDVMPLVTTKYWVKVRSATGVVKNSETATITVQNSRAVTYSGNFTSNDRTLTNGAYYDLVSFRVTTPGTYNFSHPGHSIALYQGFFNPLQPNTNYYGSGDSAVLGLSDYILVVSSNTLGAYDGIIDGTQPVTILPQPLLTIIQNPADKAIAPSGTTTLSVATQGGGGPSYQWYKGDSGDTSSPISGATGINFTTPALTATTKYWVRVSDGTTTVNSGTATVYVLTPPIVYADQLTAADPTFNRPQLVNGSPSLSGQNTYYKVFQFQVATSGNYTISLNTPNFQGAWMLYQGVFLAGDPIINVGDFSPTSGNPVSQTVALTASTQPYYLVITSKNGGAVGAFSVSFNGPALIVPNFPPVISTQPASKTVFTDQGVSASTTLSVGTSSAGVSYQWYKGSSYGSRTLIPGANSSTYSPTGLAVDSTSIYSVRLSNAGGYTDSNFATVKVKVRPSFLVTTLTDAPSDTLTTLRKALTSANDVGGGKITFAANLTGTIALTAALPAINGDIAILGGSQPIRIDGGLGTNIFNVSGGNVDIRNLTLANGKGPLGNPVGGGLHVTGGNVLVRGVAFIGNQGSLATNNGANSPTAAGGVTVLGGSVTLSNCTLTGNTGSGFYNSTGDIGPRGGSGAAQIYGGSLTISSCTIADNNGGAGGATVSTFFPRGLGGTGGVTRLGGTLVVANSILFNNKFGPNGSGGIAVSNTGSSNLSGTYTAQGQNLIDIDPKIGPLSQNGGPTLTYPLVEGGLALNAGDAAYATSASDYDQRGEGFARVAGGRLDVGAYEAQDPIISLTLSPDSPLTNQTLTATTTYSNFFRAPKLDYKWTVNGQIKQTGSNNKLDLSHAGYGDKGQTIVCTVTASYNAQTATASASTAVVNSAPVATASTQTFLRDGVTFEVSATDADAESLTYKVVTLPSKGTLKNGDNIISVASLPFTLTGSLTYVPQKGNTSDSFDFSASDGTASSQATVSLNFTNEAAQSGPNFVVNQTEDYDDGVCGITDCTLREAVNGANAYNAANSDAGATITFADAVFGSARQTITLGGYALEITSSVTITGPAKGVTIDANHASGVFFTNTGTVVLSNLNIINGWGSDGGGGIYNEDDGTLTLNNCTLSGNIANAVGGGALYNSGVANLNNCTLVNNSGERGGALYNKGTMTVDSCTFSGNTATNSARSIYSNGTVTFRNSIFNDAVAVAGNGTLIDGGYNLTIDAGTGSFTANTDKLNADPKLDVLGDNGGPTPTLALLPGSAAYNSGATDLTADQRGVARPQSSSDDIGAFELFVDMAAPVPAISTPGANQQILPAAFTAITGTATDNVGVSQVLVKLFRIRNNVTTFWNGTGFGTAQVQIPATLATPGATSTTWSFPVTPELKSALDLGAYSVAVYGKDAAGNQSGAIGRNFSLISDVTAPVVVVSTPAQNQTLSTAAFNSITGTVTDNISVAQVLVKLFRTRNGVTEFWNGSSFGATQVLLPVTLANPGAATTAWNFPVTAELKAALDEGAYLLAVYAKDGVGNQSGAVGRNFTLNNDVSAPTLVISTPTQNQTLTALNFNSITGTASDNVGVTQVLIKLFRTRNGVTEFWNGTSFGAAQVLLPTTLANSGATSTSWSYAVTPELQAALDNGAYLLTAYGKDAVGNQSGAVGRNFAISNPNTLRANSSAPSSATAF